MKSWKAKTPCTAVKDFFSDNIDYGLKTLEDLVRLNSKIPLVAEKFLALGEVGR